MKAFEGYNQLALPTFLPVTTTAMRGCFSACDRLAPLSSGPTVDVSVNGGATASFQPAANGKVDPYQIWSYAGGSLGNVIRASRIYNQGTLGSGGTIDYIQATDLLRPIFDFNNIQPDGTWPLAFDAFAGDLNEQRMNMTAGAGLTHNQANHTQICVIETLSNVGINDPNVTIQSMSSGTGLNALRAGNEDTTSLAAFSHNYGLSLRWNATNQYASLLLPRNRTVILEQQSSTLTVNGQLPTNINLIVNDAEFTVGGTGRISGATTGSVLGAETGGANDGGTGFLFYMNAFYGSALDANAGEKFGQINALKSRYGINTAWTSGGSVVSSSTGAGYRGRAQGVGGALKPLVKGNPRLDMIAHAGTSCDDMYANRVFMLDQITTVRQSSMNLLWSLYYNIRNNIENGDGGVSTVRTYVWPMIQYMLSRGIERVFIGTQIYTTYSGNLSTKTAQLDAANNEVRSYARAYGAILIDFNALPQFVNFNDLTYYDVDTIHMNRNGQAYWAALAATVINSNIPG